MKQLILIFAIIILTQSCKVVDITGQHKVLWVKHYGKKSVVKLEGLKKEFIFPTDTLKAGDIVNIKKSN